MYELQTIVDTCVRTVQGLTYYQTAGGMAAVVAFLAVCQIIKRMVTIWQ